MKKRIFVIVLDSFGIGEMPDAANYGDEGSNTLASVSKSAKFHMPTLGSMGLFNIDGAVGGRKSAAPMASFARMAELSKGKDTTVGHWEIAGVVTAYPLPSYPKGFPPDLVKCLSEVCSCGFLCNQPYSGTEVLRDFGAEHLRTHHPILYTSADSVMQIAAHEQAFTLERLYSVCTQARRLMQGKHGVGRIIARPFTGHYPNFSRTPNRRDYSLPPPSDTMLDHLSGAGFDVIGVGKIHDIFAGRGITRTVKTKNNADGMQKTIALAGEDFSGLCFVNLVDFDMLYGHRNDVDGYAAALSEFDLAFQKFKAFLLPDDIVIITADHGCDPATASTDHSREYTPMLIYGQSIRSGINLGTRQTFADIAATVQEYLGLDVKTQGQSFFKELMKP